MKSLQIQDGDISLASANNASFVYGKDKLKQDLSLWLREPLGTGVTSPSFGSTLESLIGSNNPLVQQTQIGAEVQRILNLYQSVQLENIKQAKYKNQLSNWSKSEIINTITKIDTSVKQDVVIVRAFFTTLSGQTQDLSILITDSGVVA